jgi:hypothetical protein
VGDFDCSFKQMMQNLEAAWAAGGKAALSKAIRIMPDLTAIATDLLREQITRTDAPGIYGPQVRINTSAPPIGFGWGNHMPVFFVLLIPTGCRFSSQN